jgi:hypothetical protein
LDKTSSGILGASSEEDINPSSSSSLSGDEESKEESEGEVIPGTEVQPHVFASFSQPRALPPFQFTNEIGTQTNESTDNTMANADATNASTNPDAFTNGQGDDDGGFNSEVASANQMESRNTTSSSMVRAGGRGTTPIAATALTTPTQLVATKKKHRKAEKTNNTRNSTNHERGLVTKSIERIASSIVEGRGDDLQTFMMMRKMEWDEAEERRRQEREEARREREEARHEREEMEDRHDCRLERQLNQQNQMMQMMMMMMMMMMMGGGSKVNVGDVVDNSKEGEDNE